MLRITIDLVPYGDERQTRRLSTMTIINDRTGTRERGNYQWAIVEATQPEDIYAYGAVTGFPRREKSAWYLIHHILYQWLTTPRRQSTRG